MSWGASLAGSPDGRPPTRSFPIGAARSKGNQPLMYPETTPIPSQQELGRQPIKTPGRWLDTGSAELDERPTAKCQVVAASIA